MAKYVCPDCNSQEFVAVVATRYKFTGEFKNGNGELLSHNIEEVVCVKCRSEAMEIEEGEDA